MWHIGKAMQAILSQTSDRNERFFMRRIIWNILVVLAVVNLVWLFVFNYKIPALPSFSSNQKEEAAVTEDEPAVMDEESLAKCAGYTGDVLLIHGLSDQSVPYDASVNMFFSIYSEANSQLLLLSGKKAVHSFDGTQPKLREVAESAVLAFLNSHTEG